MESLEFTMRGAVYEICLATQAAICSVVFDQAEKLTLTSRAFRNDQLPLLYEELCQMTNSHKMLPMNSGAEAVETVIKCARKWGYESKGVGEGLAEIIVCNDNFHGRTLSIIGFSTDENARENFGPFTPGFKTIPFGDAEALEQELTADRLRLPLRVGSLKIPLIHSIVCLT